MDRDQGRMLEFDQRIDRRSRTALAVFVAPSRSGGLDDLGQQSILERFLEDLSQLDDSDPYVLTEKRHENWVRDRLPDSGGFTLSFVGPPGRAGLVEKVDRTLETLLGAGYESVLALAADTPGLDVGAVRDARDLLWTDEPTAVVGPAGDGGFYLLGINEYRDGLLDDVPFFVERTCRELCDRIDALYARRKTLGVLDDVDRLTDWLSLDDDIKKLFRWILRLVRRLLFGRRLLEAERTLDLKNRYPFLRRTLRSPPLVSVR